MKKGKEKGKKEESKEKSDKTHVKIPLWSLNTSQKSTKTGKNLRGGGGKNFSGWPEYIPLRKIQKVKWKEIGERWGERELVKKYERKIKIKGIRMKGKGSTRGKWEENEKIKRKWNYA